MGGIPQGNVYSVYIHRTPENKVYVGVTGTDLELRWKNGKNYNNSPRFREAINRFGWRNISHEVVASGMSRKEAWDMEERLIGELKATDEAFGYNESPGYNALGENAKAKVVEKLREKTSGDSNRARPVLQIAPYTMRVVKRWPCARDAARSLGLDNVGFISNACRRRNGNRITSCTKGFFWTYEDEYDKEYFEQFIGIELTKNGTLPRTGDRASKSEMTLDGKRRVSEANSIPIMCVETGVIYNNQRIAAKEMGCCPSAIGKVVTGRHKTCSGYHWVYAEGGHEVSGE